MYRVLGKVNEVAKCQSETANPFRCKCKFQSWNRLFDLEVVGFYIVPCMYISTSTICTRISKKRLK